MKEMKNIQLVIYLTILLGLSTQTEVSGQIQKGNFNLSLSVGAQNLTSQSGGISNLISTQEKSFSVYPSIDYYFNDRFFSGLEFGFTRQNREIINNHFTQHYYQETVTETDTDVFQFSLRTGYGQPITERLYFQIISGLNYAHITQDLKFLSAGGSLIVPGLPSIGNIGSIDASQGEFDEKSDYTSFSLKPQITYFLSKSIGLNLSLGGFEYGFYDWDFENDLWILSFNTNLWRLGINFSF